MSNVTLNHKGESESSNAGDSDDDDDDDDDDDEDDDDGGASDRPLCQIMKPGVFIMNLAYWRVSDCHFVTMITILYLAISVPTNRCRLRVGATGECGGGNRAQVARRAQTALEPGR
jgi:hypothetical protein